jgi:hypothetical protein
MILTHFLKTGTNSWRVEFCLTVELRRGCTPYPCNVNFMKYSDIFLSNQKFHNYKIWHIQGWEFPACGDLFLRWLTCKHTFHISFYKGPLLKGQYSVVGIATHYGKDSLGFEPCRGWDFLHLSRQVSGLTQPPVQWAPQVHWPKLRHCIDHLPHLVLRLKRE